MKWTIYRRESGGETVQLDIRDHDEQGHQRLVAGVTIRPDRDYEANAALIAAAPEMLDALKEAKPIVERSKLQYAHQPECNCAYCKLTKAIAKAEGRFFV